jgi:hypothetical protein
VRATCSLKLGRPDYAISEILVSLVTHFVTNAA